MSLRFTAHPLNSIAVIGTHLPRLCGIATFTNDLCLALAQELGNHGHVEVLAMDDVMEGYAYPDRVKFQLAANNVGEYIRAASFININQYDVVVLQHEFGIFGGNDGAYILKLLDLLHMPVITTMHTVLLEPNQSQRRVVIELAQLSERLVVMSHKAETILEEVYGVAAEKISFIPHGIPDVPFTDPSFNKDLFDVENNKVLLTFGLLGPGKGIESMIDALPQIVKQHPDVVYIILGATHPAIVRKDGEAYRHALHERVNRLGLSDNVIFHKGFVKLEVLLQYLSCADVYVTPYPNVEQISSGTLAYAVGSGKAAVSTPYWYAEELLADGRGQLVPFNDEQALGKAISDLLGNDQERNAMRKRAYQFSRPMVWKEVARSYLDLTSDCLERWANVPKPHRGKERFSKGYDELPIPNMEHLHILTDDTGILQHAIYTTPDREHGYCVDDNARALIAASLYYEYSQDRSMLLLIQNYLSFLYYGFDRKSLRFRNFMTYDRSWRDETGSEDAHGRSLWGLGMAAKYAPNHSIRDLCSHLFADALKAVEGFTSPRAKAFSIIGIHAYLEVYGGDVDARRLRESLAGCLFQGFKDNATEEWHWPEDSLAYANAKIPQALILAGQWIPNPEMLEMGLRSLNWLLEQQTAPEGHLSLVGNDEWQLRGKERPRFDQQPIDAMCLVEACAEAFRSTGEEKWHQEARRCLAWFKGHNDLNVALCDFKTGGCSDGLMPHGANRNMGAESTLAWLIALLTMHKLSSVVVPED